MNAFRHNLRFGVRSWRRAPGFALAAMLSLALGIGLSTAVFTVADALLLRSLPVRDQDRIVMIAGEMSGTHVARYPLTLDDAREFARRTRSMESVGYFADFGSWPKPIRDGDRVSRLRRAVVSANFFDVLGAHSTLGRTLQAADGVAGAAPVIVLSYAAWQQRFGGDPHVVGRRIVTYDDSTAYTVVGVMAQGLEFPRGTEFWAPIVLSSNAAGLKFVTVNLVGRLAAGAAPARARDEMTAFFNRAEAPAWQHRLHGVVTTLPQLVLGDTRLALLVFAAACALLLLITCINVASLLLVRGMARTREMAVRTAIGASRAQIVMQLLTESTLLAVAGGALGVAFAAGAVRAFIALAPAGVPRADEIQLNVTALAAAIGITAVAQPRLNAVLLALFAGAAVALAAVGLFGVLATLVRQRTNEFGVRMALGATAGDVRSAVMRRGLAIAISGSALGLLGAIATTRLLATLLYDVRPTDPMTLVAVTALLVGIAAVASLIPAQWSARIDPVVALRADV